MYCVRILLKLGLISAHTVLTLQYEQMTLLISAEDRDMMPGRAYCFETRRGEMLWCKFEEDQRKKLLLWSSSNLAISIHVSWLISKSKLRLRSIIITRISPLAISRACSNWKIKEKIEKTDLKSLLSTDAFERREVDGSSLIPGRPTCKWILD